MCELSGCPPATGHNPQVAGLLNLGQPHHLRNPLRHDRDSRLHDRSTVTCTVSSIASRSSRAAGTKSRSGSDSKLPSWC